jgi:hypothetical protein
MNAHLALLFASIALLASIVSCGASQTAIIVDVDVSRFRVPDDVDRLFLQLEESDGATIGRTETLPAGIQRAPIELIRGPRTSLRPTLVVFAYRGTALIAQSSPTTLSFAEGRTTKVEISLF